MKVVYAPRATRDLEAIADYYHSIDDPRIAAAVAERIEYVINRLGRLPRSAPRVIGRANVRIALVLRFPYKIYYRLRADEVEILHIRHTARHPWGETDD